MNPSPSTTPVVTAMQVIPVAGQDSMLLNLSGAHAPYFTRNLVILTDSSGHTGLGEVPGGEPPQLVVHEREEVGGGRPVAPGGRLDQAGDLPLLGNRQDIVHRPVKHQTCREPEEHEGEDDRHQHEHLLLNGISGRRRQAHLPELRRAHQNGRDVERIVAREVVKAEEIVDYTPRENVAERLAKRTGRAA